MKSKMYKVHCAKCESDWMIKVESIVHAQNESALRGMILQQAFFTRKCSKCATLLTFYYPFLYCDSSNQFLIALCEEEAQWIKELEMLDQYQNYHKRIVSTQSALKEMIVIFENKLVDTSVYMIKEALYEKHGTLILESVEADCLWFQSSKGPLGVSKQYYQKEESEDKKFIRR